MRARCIPAMALVSLLGACSRHTAGLLEVGSDECVACHRAEYESTSMPAHAGRFPETCADCHSTDSWIPALEGGHPEETFAVTSGAHAGIVCLECHRAELGPSTAGANTDCIGCHTGDHAQAPTQARHRNVPMYAWTEATPSSCLDCHPSGALPLHPEAAFRIGGGKHSGFFCNDCHDHRIGDDDKVNSSCIGCHTGDHDQGRMDNAHEGEDGYAWDAQNPDFCRDCHPDGTKD